MALDKLQYEFKVDGTLGILLKAADMLDNIEGKLAKLANKKIDFGSTLRQAQGLEALSNSVQNATQGMTNAVMKTAALSDQMAIAQKNTGLADAEMQGLKKTIDLMNTRTSTGDLLGIASMGGKLGVAKKELAGFVQVVDKATVALGDEFGGSAEAVATVLGRIKGQYKEFAGVPFAEALQGIGSAINYLGKQGANSAPVVGEFAQRVLTLQLGLANAVGMGATLQELGLSAEIASGGLQNILTLAKTESAKFAQHLKMPVKAFEELVNKSPNDVVLRLADSFKGASQTQIAQTMDKLKIGSQESQRVVSLLASNTDLLRARQVQANFALQKKNDLDKEASIMNNTLAAQIAKTQKQFDEYIVGLGAGLAPYMNVIQTTAFLSTGMAALIPLISLMSNLLLGGFQALLRYGLGITFVDGKLKFAQTSLIGFMIQLGRFIVITSIQAVRATLLFAGQLVMMAAMALPALIASLGGASVAMAFFNAIAMINPFILMMIGAVAVIGIIAGLIHYFGGFTKMLAGVWNFVLAYNPFSLLIKAIDYLFGTNIFGQLQSWFNTITGWLDGIWKKAKAFFNWVTGTSEKLDKTEKASTTVKKTDEAKKAKSEALELEKMYKQAGIDPKKIGQIKPDATDMFASGLTTQPNLKGSSQTQKNIEGVSGGGSKPTNINISIGKLNEKIEISTVNLKEGVDEIEKIVSQMLLRVTNNANQYAGS